MKALKAIAILLVSFNRLFAQDADSALDVRKIEVYHIMKHLTDGPYTRTNGHFKFRFEINENGEPLNLEISPSISDSLTEINSAELAQLKFTSNGQIQNVSFQIFSHYTRPIKHGDDQVFEAYEREEERFQQADESIAAYIENGSEIELRPFLSRGISCGELSLSSDDILKLESPMEIKMPRKLTLPGH